MTDEQRRYREALEALDAAYKAARADLVRRMEEASGAAERYGAYLPKEDELAMNEEGGA